MTAAPLRWMPAKVFGGRLRATVVVIHCTESDNNSGTAESLAGPNWFGGPAGTSAHRMFDRDSGVEMVRRSTVAFHAGPRGNTVGRSYEFCGQVAWSAAKWREPAQLNMLRLAAPYIAEDLVEITGSRQAAIAACRWLSLVQLAKGEHGLCTHNDIRLALGGTTHSDPGPRFPYAELLAYVLAELTGTATQEDDMAQADIDEIKAGIAELKRMGSLGLGVEVTKRDPRERTPGEQVLQGRIGYGVATLTGGPQSLDAVLAEVFANSRAVLAAPGVDVDVEGLAAALAPMLPTAVAGAVATMPADQLAAIAKAVNDETDRRVRDGDPATGPVS